MSSISSTSLTSLAAPSVFDAAEFKKYLKVLQSSPYREDIFFKMGRENFETQISRADNATGKLQDNSFYSLKIKFTPEFDGLKQLRILKSEAAYSAGGWDHLLHVTEYPSNRKKLFSLSYFQMLELSGFCEKMNQDSSFPVKAKFIFDISASGRMFYPTEAGFWDGLSGYKLDVSDFYAQLHQALIQTLKIKILENDLRNIVLVDVGCGTGNLISKLLLELSEDNALYGRIVKMIGVDFSEENITSVKAGYGDFESKLVTAEKALTPMHSFAYAEKLREQRRLVDTLHAVRMSAADLGNIEVKEGETLICITSGGLTRHVMPFEVAQKAFEAMAKKKCRFFLGSGLENVWMNPRIAKSLGFKFEAGENFPIFYGRSSAHLRRIMTLDGVELGPRDEAEEKRAKEHEDALRLDSGVSEERGFMAAAFSKKFLDRIFEPSPMGSDPELLYFASTRLGCPIPFLKGDSFLTEEMYQFLVEVQKYTVLDFGDPSGSESRRRLQYFCGMEDQHESLSLNSFQINDDDSLSVQLTKWILSGVSDDIFKDVRFLFHYQSNASTPTPEQMASGSYRSSETMSVDDFFSKGLGESFDAFNAQRKSIFEENTLKLLAMFSLEPDEACARRLCESLKQLHDKIMRQGLSGDLPDGALSLS